MDNLEFVAHLQHELDCYKKFVENIYHWLAFGDANRVWDRDDLEHEEEICDCIEKLKSQGNVDSKKNL